MNTETSTQAATTSDPMTKVFVTRTGKTYHSEFCAMGSNRGGANRAQKTASTIRAQVRYGKTACSHCSAPTYTGPMK
jgi:hypothetical protein